MFTYIDNIATHYSTCTIIFISLAKCPCDATKVCITHDKLSCSIYFKEIVVFSRSNFAQWFRLPVTIEMALLRVLLKFSIDCAR
jgi:hypothetical protein